MSRHLLCNLTCLLCMFCCLFFFFKQKTAYEMRISDWSSDVCSSDLLPLCRTGDVPFPFPVPARRKGAHVPGNAGFAACARSCCGLSKNVSHLQNQSMTASRIRCAATPFLLPSMPRSIGRWSCKERVCKDVYISVVAVPLHKKQNQKKN